ncbi:MAG: HNH endonuclease [Chloroflexota bacterium]
MKCIYCLEDKPHNSFTKAEHVIPQSFGRFQDNFTLNGVVCDECNQYFGDHLEIDLGRDTLEGISRYKYGTQSPKDFKTLGRRSRLRLQVAEGPLKGAFSYLEYSQEHNTVVVKPLPQVGFLDRGSLDYRYFPLEEIPNKAELEAQDLDCNRNMRVFVDSAEKARQTLSEIGISLEFQGGIAGAEGESGQWLHEVEGSIDKIICRAIAKIAFNYLAYWQDAESVLQEVFDPIRFYIRNGEQGSSPFVLVHNQSILADEPSQESRRLIHIITVNWAQDGVSVISRVSLFNNILSYIVQLARDYSGKNLDLRKGHFFNLSDHRIYELTAR